MSAEQTPDIADVLAEHRLRWPTRCTCGWKTTITGDARNAEGVDVLVQYDAHVAAALAPVLAAVLAAAVREAEQRALREAASKVANYRNGATGRRAANSDLFGQVLWAMADDIEYQQERHARADRITEPASPRDPNLNASRSNCDGCVNAAFDAGTTARPLRADGHDLECIAEPVSHEGDR